MLAPSWNDAIVTFSLAIEQLCTSQIPLLLQLHHGLQLVVWLPVSFRFGHENARVLLSLHNAQLMKAGKKSRRLVEEEVRSKERAS